MILIKNARIYGLALSTTDHTGNHDVANPTEGTAGAVCIVGDRIEAVLTTEDDICTAERNAATVIDAHGALLLPGVIDAHVHFREPGLTAKADIASESRAAVAGGVTSVLDMPNVRPATTSYEALNEKLGLFAAKSLVNYGVFFGITHDNIDEALTVAREDICGYKVFLGSSTGGMLMDDPALLRRLFADTRRVIAVHSENEEMIRRNIEYYKKKYASPNDGGNIPVELHPQIRSREACYHSTEAAVKLARETGAQLHVCHITTGKELSLFSDDGTSGGTASPVAPASRQITAEACVAHLWFSDKDYERLGSKIKCNPAIKTGKDRAALRKALTDGRIDLVATDHAPHLCNDKQGDALTAASGMPSLQYSLVAMLELSRRNICSIADVVRLMCQTPALRYSLLDRGFIRPGYKADLVLVDPGQTTVVTPEDIRSKCGWSPFEGETFHHKVIGTWVNGTQVYDGIRIDETTRGEKLTYNFHEDM